VSRAASPRLTWPPVAEVLQALGDGAASDARALVATIVAAGSLYGAFMGSYACHSVERLVMVLYSTIKVPLLIFATTAVCLPGFFVFNTVAGLRDTFARAMRAIVAGQAATALALGSLAPVVRFLYLSGIAYRHALVANSALFTIATIAGQRVLGCHYRRLIDEEPRHRIMLRLWLGLYAFVGMQMGWMLRPFIGVPDVRVTFFRDEPFSNAYVVIAHLFF
jgi:hypothetical protein